MTKPLPPLLAQYADDVSGRDPRFSWLFLGDQRSLRELADADEPSDVLIEGVEIMVKHLASLPLEDNMTSLLTEAYAAHFTKPLTTEMLQAMCARFGVGRPPVTLQVAADIVGVTRERIRQVTAKVEKAIKGAFVPQLVQIVELLVEQSPVPHPIGQLLATEGLAGPDLSAHSLLSIIELVDSDVWDKVGTTLEISGDWLVDVRDKVVTDARRIVSKHTSTYGMTTLEDVRQALSTPSQPVDVDDVRRVLEADPSVHWAGSWLWVAKEDNLHANSMVNTVRSILSVNSPQSVESLQAGLRRQWKFRDRDIVPTVEAMRVFLQTSELFDVTDGLVSSVAPLDYHVVQGEVAAAMIDVLKESPYQVMDRASLQEACAAAGIAAGTYGVWTTYAEWMDTFGTNVWGLRGSNPSPAVVKEVQRAAKLRHASEAHRTEWSWSPDGGIVLTADVFTSARTSGTLSFDPSLLEQLGTAQFDLTYDGAPAGRLRTSGQHFWTWGWGKVFAATKAKVGDVLRVTLDLTTGTGVVVIGGQELWR